MLLASGATEIAQVARMSPHADEPECKGYEVSCIFVERVKDRPCDTPHSHAGSKGYSRMC